MVIRVALQHGMHRLAEPLPSPDMVVQSDLSGGSEGVILAAPPALLTPLPGDQPLPLQRVEGRVEGALLEAQAVPAAPLDLPGDGVAVTRLVPEDGQDQGGGAPFQEFPAGIAVRVGVEVLHDSGCRIQNAGFARVCCVGTGE